MRKAVDIYDILISCPGDVAPCVPVLKDAIHNFSQLYGRNHNITVTPRYWKDDAFAESGGKPQELLNRQLVDDSDMAVVVFWTRFGTPTDNYGSGVEEEIERMLCSGKQVFLYFFDKPISPGSIDWEGYRKIENFKKKYESRGIYKIVKDEQELKSQFSADLERYFMQSENLIGVATPNNAQISVLPKGYRVQETKIAIRKENLRGQSVLCDLPFGCIGRDNKYTQLERLLQYRVPVVINGVAGIGKTALCSYYYQKQREKNPEYFVLYVDVSGCDRLDGFLQAVCRAIDLNQHVELRQLSEYFIEHRDSYQAIVFDNWEELQCNLAKTIEWDEVRDLLMLLAKQEISILIASQEKAPSGWKSLELEELDHKDGELMFKSLLLQQGKDIDNSCDEEKQAFRSLLDNMENHPLTIVLTASLVEGRYYDLRRIQENWSHAYNETAKYKHRSLHTALKMSFDAISDRKGASLLWGIISCLFTDFPLSYLDILKTVIPDIPWEEAERALIRRCLIRNTEANALHMLMSVKTQWTSLAGPILHRQCREAWGNLMPMLLQIADAPGYTHNPKKSNALKKEIIQSMDSFLHITKQLIIENNLFQAEQCVQAMGPFYELVGTLSSSFLETIPVQKFSVDCQGIVYKCRGDIARLSDNEHPNHAHMLYSQSLDRFTKSNNTKRIVDLRNSLGLNYLWNYCDFDKAMEQFCTAEKHARDSGYFLGLAEALKNKGITLTNGFRKYDSALACFMEAETLYQEVGDYRGLAHVYKRMGVISFKKGDTLVAIDAYEHALSFYRQTHYTQGSADTLSRLCIAYMKSNNREQLQRVYEEAMKIFEVIPFEITRKDLKQALDQAQRYLENQNPEK